jgi:hypothetical protein
MTVAEKIKQKIDRIDIGALFGYAALGITPNEVLAASKAISRLAADGTIRRAKRGIYYKPRQSAFGEVKPREEVLLSRYLFDNNRQIAYITGIRLYNRLGLTTQVPNSVHVASAEKQIKGKVGNLLIKPAKSYVKVTQGNIRYLEFLDVIKDLNAIPDLNKKDGFDYLKSEIIRFDNNNEIKKLVSYGLEYPPKVKALLGAMLEDAHVNSTDYRPLKNAINPMSQYKYGVNPKLLPNANNWNII